MLVLPIHQMQAHPLLLVRSYKMKYELANDLISGAELIKGTTEDGQVWWIPINPENADYQAYLNKDTLPSELPIPSTPQAGE